MIQETSLLLTKRELEAVDKKLKKMKLTQQDSNCLSRYVRPKLREMISIDSKALLKELAYNQKIKAVENKVKALILDNIKYVSSITLYGSVVYSGYSSYKDVDVLVAVKDKFWDKLGEKYRLILKLKKEAKKKGLNLDIKIFLDRDIYESYPSNITLIYELKDSKTIYGILQYPNEIKIDKISLKFHMDYSYSTLLDTKENSLTLISGREIYSAIRNLWIIRLIIDKIVDNESLLELLNSELGKNIICSLKENTASLSKKKIASIYLEELYKKVNKIVESLTEEITWERMI